MDKNEFIFLNRISSVDSINGLFLTFEALWDEIIFVDFALTNAKLRSRKRYKDIKVEEIDINFTQIETFFSIHNLAFIENLEDFFKNLKTDEKKFKYVVFPVIINKSLKNLIIVDKRFSSEIYKLAGNILFNFFEKISFQNLVEKSKIYFEAILNNLNSTVMIVDKNFNLIFSNKEVKNIYKCYELAFNKDKPCMFCFQQDKTITIRINNKTYEIQHIILPQNFVCIIKDITNLIEIKTELMKAQQLSMLGKFSSEITHEIKNPLNSIKLKLEILKRKYTNSKEIAEIENEIKRLTEITNDFLQLGKTVDLNFNEINLKNFFKEIKNSYRENLEREKINLEINCKDLKVKGDETKLKQVFFNLINNSIDALKDKKNDKKIIILCEEKENEINIYVKDNGKGIKNPDKLFTPFYTEKDYGSGLGLIIVKRIIEAHKGKIEFVDDYEYTIFKIILPLNS